MQAVLDASAVLAWLQNEPGADTVEPLIAEACISAANWSEILQKVAQRGRSAAETRELLLALGVQVIPLNEEDAVLAATLWEAVPALSLADRCCLALAQRLGVPAVTADSGWASLSTGVQIVAIR